MTHPDEVPIEEYLAAELRREYAARVDAEIITGTGAGDGAPLLRPAPSAPRRVYSRETQDDDGVISVRLDTDHSALCGTTYGCECDCSRPIGWVDEIATLAPVESEARLPHPATYSPQVQTAIIGALERHLPNRPRSIWRVIDPFAGVGTIFDITADRPDIRTYAVELEPEWANTSRVIQGDARHLDRLVAEGRIPSRVDAIVTSPCYGNRMADTYLGQNDTCTMCEGAGHVDVVDESGMATLPCPRCQSTGRSPSRRYTYATALGRAPSEGSAAAMQWGPRYRDFHAACIANWIRLSPRVAIINISDHVRQFQEQGVHLWWVGAMCANGWRLQESIPVTTPRMGHGQNGWSRVSCEWVLTFVRGW